MTSLRQLKGIGKLLVDLNWEKLIEYKKCL